MAEGHDENRAASQVRSGGYGWGLAALIAGLLPLLLMRTWDRIVGTPGSREPALLRLAQPAYTYVWPAVSGVLGLCAVACAVVAVRHRGGPRVLAVVALILAGGWLICAGVFFAVMPTSTENACLSNVHNLAMAMGMYAADDNAHLPPAARWPEALSAYVYDRSTFSCSMDGVHEPEVNGPMDASYSMNRYLGGASLSTAASLPLLFDGLALRGDKTTAAFRHAGGLNVSYADGHAQWLSRKAFLDGSLKPKTQP